MQDIKDAVNFIDQPVMIDSNLVNIGAKFGFAVCDAVMERRDFEYAAIAADAALYRASMIWPLKTENWRHSGTR